MNNSIFRNIDTMNIYGASKSAGNEERRKVPKSQPVRIHELLGLPKSEGKIIQPQRSQPVRIKEALESVGSCSRGTVNSSARRMTVAPGSTKNIRRQLYREAANRTVLDKNMQIAGESQSTTETSAKKFINDSECGKFQPLRLLGLSKSEGKSKTNDQRPQPVRVKQLLESMEKSETAKPAGRKSTANNVRTKNVRRKLYSVLSSPVSSQKVARKSLALNTTKNNVNITNKACKIVEPDSEKFVKAAAAQKPSRKSHLLPPNFIRDKYISRQATETILEESPNAVSPEMQNITNAEKSPKEKKIEVENICEIHQAVSFPEAKSLLHVSSSINSIVCSSSQEDDKVFEADVEIPRPTVIVGLVTSTVAKNPSQSSSESSDKSVFALSRSPLQEINRNSVMPLQRLDAVDTSLEDLLGNSCTDRQISFPKPNLLCNSFLCNRDSNEKSLSCMDQQTLSWLHANLKLCIQTTEESLFSMKRMLKTIEDIVKTSSEPEEAPVQKNTDDYVPVVSDENEEENKENMLVVNNGMEEADEEDVQKTRRRSARLAAIQARSPKNSDDSFSRIEAELNITHVKSKPVTPRTATPAKRNTVDLRSRRSIREYMALKSCIKFLQTPDQKGLPTPKGDRTGTPAERRAIEKALSRQLLTQLNDLYDDSPE